MNRNEYLYKLSETRPDLLDLPTEIKNFIDSLVDRITEGSLFPSDYLKWGGYRNSPFGFRMQITLILHMFSILKHCSEYDTLEKYYETMSRHYVFLEENSNFLLCLLLLLTKMELDIVPTKLSKSASKIFYKHVSAAPASNFSLVDSLINDLKNDDRCFSESEVREMVEKLLEKYMDDKTVEQVLIFAEIMIVLNFLDYKLIGWRNGDHVMELLLKVIRQRIETAKRKESEQ